MPVKRPEPKPMKSSDDTDTSNGLKPEESKTVGVDCGVQQQQQGSGMVQKNVTDREKDGTLQQIGPDQFAKEASLKTHIQNCKDQAPSESTSTSQKTYSVSTRTNALMRSSSSRTTTNPSPMGFKSSIDASVQSGNSSSSDIQKVRGNDVSDQQMVVSAKHKIFVPKTTVCQYRPRNLGGSRIKSAAPRTKPRPQWCPEGLTHTQKRRLQRLRALEIKEEIAKKNKDKWFNEDKLMVPPKMTWKEKCIVKVENRNTDDTVAAQNSENSRDAPTDMSIDKGG
jgi:hypothetical protein